MWQLILGVLLIAAGGISMWFGGQLASEGWKKKFPEISNAELQRQQKGLYKVTITSVTRIRYPGPLLFFYNSQLGKTISPISVAFYIEIANNKDTISKIQSYSTKALLRYDDGGETKIIQDRSGGRKFIFTPSGKMVEKWHSLHSVGPLHDEVYWVGGNDWTKCQKIDFSKNSFEVLARDKHLQPGESIAGWVFFELPANLRVQLPEILEFEVTVTNSQGESQTIRTNSPVPDEGSNFISSGAWHFSGGYHDLTKGHFVICPQVDLREMLKQKQDLPK